MFNVKLLEQQRYAPNADDDIIRVAEMSAPDAEETLSRLYEDAAELQQGWVMMLSDIMGLAAAQLLGPDGVRELLAQAAAAPTCWLTMRPLVAALSVRTLSDLPMYLPRALS
jgi:hypothetical protein